jgi:hypothetical protein
MTASAPILRIRTPRVEIEEGVEGPNEKYKYIHLVQRTIIRLASCFLTLGLILVMLFALFSNIWLFNMALACFLMAFLFHKSVEFDVEEVSHDIEQGN